MMDFRLVERQPVILARVEDRRMAEDDQAGSRPHLEMAEPELLVDEPEAFVDRLPLLGRRLDVRESQELQDLVLGPPDAAELVLRPAAGCGGDDLPFARAFARPAASLEILLENLDRSAVVPLFLDFFVAQDSRLRSRPSPCPCAWRPPPGRRPSPRARRCGSSGSRSRRERRRPWPSPPRTRRG